MSCPTPESPGKEKTPGTEIRRTGACAFSKEQSSRRLVFRRVLLFNFLFCLWITLLAGPVCGANVKLPAAILTDDPHKSTLAFADLASLANDAGYEVQPIDKETRNEIMSHCKVEGGRVEMNEK